MVPPSQGLSGDAPPKWWRVSLRAKGVGVLVLPIAALFGALFSVYWVEGDVRDADQSVVRFYGIRAELGEVRSSLLDSQTAVSGYTATGERRFLDVYDNAAPGDGGGARPGRGADGADPEAMASLGEIRAATADELRLLDQIRDIAGRLQPQTAALMEREKSGRWPICRRASPCCTSTRSGILPTPATSATWRGAGCFARSSSAARWVRSGRCSSI